MYGIITVTLSGAKSFTYKTITGTWEFAVYFSIKTYHILYMYKKNIHVFFSIKLHGNIVGRIISAKCKIVLITASNQ